LSSSSSGTSRLTTGIGEIDERQDFTTAIPADFDLGQNYPNPFNPSTNTTYTLTKPGYDRLVVYNQPEQRVATLIEGNRLAGKYTVTWFPANLASGIYFYRLQANGVAITRRMLLIR